MSNIIPFESAQLPAYLRGVDVSNLNDDLTSHAGTGFPVISIKGKVFAIVRDGERSIIPNPKDEDSPATSIEMVLVKANKGTSKVFYANGYQEGAEAGKPDCYSNEGVRPDPSVDVPVSKSCAACPNNVWGSKIGDNGNKGKKCQDSVRLAVSTPDQINEPYLIRVPPASIRALGEYGQMLKKRGVAYDMVVTKIGFDMESPTPLLTFKAVGFLPEDAYKEVKETALTDVVQNITGAGTALPSETPDTKEDDAAVAAIEAAAASAKAAAVKKPVVPKVATKEKVVAETEVLAAVKEAEKPAPAVHEGGDLEINLDDINFDD